MKKLNDYIVLSLALGAAFVFVYFVPVLLNRFLFFIFIYLFYKSDRDYIWLAFIFIILEGPGGLFGQGLRTDDLRLPLYSIFPGFSISFVQIFIFTALVKALKKNIAYNPYPFLKNNLINLLYYFIFLILVGILIGFSYDVGVFLYRTIINLTLFYSVYCLIIKESDFVNLFKMLLPFGFFIFGLQLYELSVGHPLIKYFKPYLVSGTIKFDMTKADVRPIESTNLTIIIFFFSMYFLLNKKKYFNRNILIALNIVMFFSIFITGTRSYVIMFSVFYLLTFIFISVRIGSMFLRYGLAAILTILIIFSSEVFVNQLNNAFMRISSIQFLAAGDITAGGTMMRYDVRAPAVMEAFYNNSTIIFGAGFSDTYLRHADYHVGYHNLLLNMGIVGAILVAIFIGSVILNSVSFNRRLNLYNPYKNTLKIFSIAIISILFVNGGTMYYGYDVDTNRFFLLIYILYFLNNQISCAVKWEEENSY